jgi:hypothetical protein
MSCRDSVNRKRYFLFANTSGPDTGTTQPPIRCESWEGLVPTIKWPTLEACLLKHRNHFTVTFSNSQSPLHPMWWNTLEITQEYYSWSAHLYNRSHTQISRNGIQFNSRAPKLARELTSLTEGHAVLEVGVSGVQNWFDNRWTWGFSLVKSLNYDVSLHGDSEWLAIIFRTFLG